MAKIQYDAEKSVHLIALVLNEYVTHDACSLFVEDNWLGCHFWWNVQKHFDSFPVIHISEI